MLILMFLMRRNFRSFRFGLYFCDIHILEIQNGKKIQKMVKKPQEVVNISYLRGKLQIPKVGLHQGHQNEHFYAIFSP